MAQRNAKEKLLFTDRAAAFIFIFLFLVSNAIIKSQQDSLEKNQLAELSQDLESLHQFLEEQIIDLNKPGKHYHPGIAFSAEDIEDTIKYLAKNDYLSSEQVQQLRQAANILQTTGNKLFVSNNTDPLNELLWSVEGQEGISDTEAVRQIDKALSLMEVALPADDPLFAEIYQAKSLLQGAKTAKEAMQKGIIISLFVEICVQLGSRAAKKIPRASNKTKLFR